MSEWKKYKLSDVVEIKYGKDHKHLADGDIPVYGSGGIMRFADKFLYDKESILIPRKGTLSNLFFLNSPFWSVDTMFYTKIKEGNNGKYLYYLLKSMDLASMNVGSAVPSLTTEVLNKVEINVPDEDTQIEIAQILTSLDDKIELNLHMNQTLEAMAQALFKEWFVEQEKESWETACLGDLIEIKGGFSYEGKYIGTGDDLLLGMGCVSFNERFLFSGARPYFGECGNNHLVKPGDIVIATRQQSDNLPILGFPAKIPISFKGKKVIVGTNLYRIINKSNINNSLLFQLFRSEKYKNHILSNSKGSTVRMITKDSIELFEFKMPPKELIQGYESILMSIDDKLEMSIDQIQTLTKTRDSLLPRLMSGKIEIENIL